MYNKEEKLIDCIVHGDLNGVRELIKQGVDVNFQKE